LILLQRVVHKALKLPRFVKHRIAQNVSGYHQKELISTVKNSCEIVRVSTVFGIDFQINAMQTSANRTCFAGVDGTDGRYSSSSNWGRLRLGN
jgi:hypothetical protein